VFHVVQANPNGLARLHWRQQLEASDWADRIANRVVPEDVALDRVDGAVVVE
jgi:hypothetical protein